MEKIIRLKDCVAVSISSSLSVKVVCQSTRSELVMTGDSEKHFDLVTVLQDNGMLKLGLKSTNKINICHNESNIMTGGDIIQVGSDYIAGRSIINKQVNIVITQDAIALPRIEIFLPSFKELFVSGSSSVAVFDINEEYFSIKTSGSSDAFLSGFAKVINAMCSGSSNLHGAEMRSERACVSVSGSSDLKLALCKDFEAYASGASDIVVFGKPENIKIQKSGSAEIELR